MLLTMRGKWIMSIDYFRGRQSTKIVLFCDWSNALADKLTDEMEIPKIPRVRGVVWYKYGSASTCCSLV